MKANDRTLVLHILFCDRNNYLIYGLSKTTYIWMSVVDKYRSSPNRFAFTREKSFPYFIIQSLGPVPSQKTHPSARPSTSIQGIFLDPLPQTLNREEQQLVI